MAEFKVQKSGGLQIRGSIGEFRGESRIDIREYYMAGPDDFHPSKKGISIPVEHLDKFKKWVASL